MIGPDKKAAAYTAFRLISDSEDGLLQVSDLATAIILCVEESMTEKGVRAIISCSRIIQERVQSLEHARMEAFSALHPLVYPATPKPCA